MTAPWLLDHAPYTPFMEQRTAHPPGLSPLVPGDWTVVDPDFAAQVAYRTNLLARVPDRVLISTPGSRPAIDELYTTFLAYLADRADYQIDGARVIRPDGAVVTVDPDHPMQSLCALTADDFCLLLPDEASGEYRLVAGLLCFPSQWLLSEKVGLPLTAIHDPVPDYDAGLARRVNRVFGAIRPGSPMVRVNWLVHATAELHLPLGISDKIVHAANPADGLYLRTERQTLTRLAETGAVVFGIKTSLCPLDVLTPDQAAALRRELASLDPATIDYRSGTHVHQAALDRLGQISSSHG